MVILCCMRNALTNGFPPILIFILVNAALCVFLSKKRTLFDIKIIRILMMSISVATVVTPVLSKYRFD
jgi:hypothetical protein